MKAELDVLARRLPERYELRVRALDASIIKMMERFAPLAARLALGITFIWFGALKPFGMSPAGELVAATVYFVPPELFVPVLGVWEVIIGICLLYKPLIRLGLLLLGLQLVGTFLPLVLLPGVTFTAFPYAPTLEGQYIMKNLLIIAAALVVGSSVASLDEE